MGERKPSLVVSTSRKELVCSLILAKEAILWVRKLIIVVVTVQVPDDLLEEAKAAAKAALEEMDAD